MKLLSFPRLPAHSRPENLSKIVEHLEEEARMVMPAIQALFGFQLIAVFNQRFEALGAEVQRRQRAPAPARRLRRGPRGGGLTKPSTAL